MHFNFLSVVVLLLVIIGFLLLRRHRRRRANQQTEALVEQGAAPLIDRKNANVAVDEKRSTATISPPASSAGSESRTSSRTSRIRRAVRNIIPSSSAMPIQSHSSTSPDMSEARQGVLISVPSESQTPTTSAEPSTLADLSLSSSPMTETGSNAGTFGGTVSISRVHVRDDVMLADVEVDSEIRPPPTYDSLMGLGRGE